MEFYSLWDPNQEDERLFEKFNHYYGEFSNDIRKSLLYRNVENPKSVYDVLYPNTREELLSKNEPTRNDILKDSEEARRIALNKIVPNISDVYDIAENFRKELLSKNSVLKGDNILIESERARKLMLSKNVPISSDIEKENQRNREDLLKKNVILPNDLGNDSVSFREDNVSKNTPQTSSIEKSSVDFRESNLDKNVAGKSNIENEAKNYRSDNLKKNTPFASDINKDSVDFRNQNIANNVTENTDLEKDSQQTRKDNLDKNVEKTSNIESESAGFRNRNLENNVPSETSIENDSAPLRGNNLGNNVPSETSIENDSIPFRSGNLSNNTPISTDVENDSAPFRADNLNNNVPSETSIESDSIPFRSDNLSNNTPISTSVETESAPFRADNLDNNVPLNTSLESDSAPFRVDNLNNNVPSETSIETDSAPFRTDNLDNNVPLNTSIESDSVPFRGENLGNNVPLNTSIESDSAPFRADNLDNNVPSDTSIESDSVPFREGNLDNNVPSDTDIFIDSIIPRNNNVAQNVASNTNIESDSEPFRLGNLDNNVPSETNIDNDSVQFREDNLGNNVPFFSNLNEDSEIYRTNLLAYNNFEQTDIESESEVYRTSNLSNNVNTSPDLFQYSIPFRQFNLSKNPTTTLGVNIEGFGTQAFIGVSRNFAIGIPLRAFLLSRNTYQPQNFLSAGNEYKDGDEGLLKSGNYKGFYQRNVKDEILAQNLKNGQESIGYSSWAGTPKSISAENLLGVEPGVAKTFAGNPLDSDEFVSPDRSLKNLIKTISQNTRMNFSQNFVYGQTEFVVGTKDGAPKTVRQRYSIQNPYNSGQNSKSAGSIIFAITNYAITNNEQVKTMYFPPYIQSFNESENASFNGINMLGRPEAIYVYQNSKRGGSLSFYVLSDYTENVIAGYNFDSSSDLLIKNTVHFTDRNNPENDLVNKAANLFAQIKGREKEITKGNQDILRVEEELSDFNANYADNGERLSLPGEKQKFNQDKNSLRESIREATATLPSLNEQYNGLLDNLVGKIAANFISENIEQKNIYSYIDGIKANLSSSDTEAQKMVEELIKGLAIQPAFFSGDKVDFRRRMAFLSKLTRPGENPGNGGFSFIRPPVCHLRLGDWLDHDVIIDSISKDYSDATWCLETGSVQPMWASVTINFTTIGPYGTYENMDDYRPLTSNDLGGYYGVKRNVW